MDFLSRSAIWKDSAMFVTEDDAQGGVDHVDAHRSVLLAISPYIRKGVVSHRHSSMGSIQKTAYELLGLGPLNLEDRLAADLSDMFAATPDLAPYAAVNSDPRVFDPAKARMRGPRTLSRRGNSSTATIPRRSKRSSSARRRRPRKMEHAGQ